MKQFDVIIIGAGAAGLMCAIEAGKRQRKVLVLDHANKPGKKILMSGGGRCNFTNYFIQPECYISHNPHFCKSALTRYTQWDFIALVERYKIPYHEKSLGQLFCDHKSKDILAMLLCEVEKANAAIQLNTHIRTIESISSSSCRYKVTTDNQTFKCESIIIATGGLSIPTMGSSPFAYKTAEQFNMKVWPTRAGLVPFTLQPKQKDLLSNLSGIAVDSIVCYQDTRFRENILFTHRGLSGPAILQISSYWQPSNSILINLLPEIDLVQHLKLMQKQSPNLQLKTVLNELLPKRLIQIWLQAEIANQQLADMSYSSFYEIAKQFHEWRLKPSGTEGYRTAEVTLGGIDCNALSSKTMEANTMQGLYFIGEAVDVTGWLGGYNFQWAWSSGWAAGQVC